MTTATPTLPPGPSASAAEQAIKWMGRPYAFLRACRDELGDPFTLDLGPHGKWVLFSRPEANRAIFTGPAAVLHAGKAHVVLRDFLGEHSLLQLEEEAHLRERKLLMPPFQSRNVVSYAPMMRDVTRALTEGWQVGEQVVLHDVMQRISLGVMLRAVFGLEGAQLTELEHLVLEFLADPKFNLATMSQLRKDVSDSGSWKNYWACFERINQLVLDHVEARRRTGGGGDDVLAMLLAAHDEQGRPMTDDELRDELVTLLVTGFETTATGLAWAFHWVLRNQPVLERLRSELEGPEADPAKHGGAKYLDAVCRETLRIHPVVPLVARQVQQPFEIEGYAIPPGVTVSACIYLTHHRPDLYPEPDTFLPERFLEREYSPYEWLPFGGGARRCLAMPLALLEMRIVIATILSDWDLELESPESVTPQRRSVSIRPSDGTTVVVRLDRRPRRET